MQTHILRLQAVCSKVALSKSHIWRLVANRQFPAPIPLGPNSRGWLESEVQDWLNERIAARDAGEVSASGVRQ